LTAELGGWVDDLVKSGEYRSVSEVVRAGLRALREQRELHVAQLAEIQERIRRGAEQAERGEFVPGTLDEVAAWTFEKAKERVRQAS
jgi:putative addiction module CopG family antidote